MVNSANRRAVLRAAFGIAAVSAGLGHATLSSRRARAAGSGQGWVSVGSIAAQAIVDARVPLAAAGLGSEPERMDVTAHVLRFRGETVLVGAGFGAHPGLPQGDLVGALAARGLAPSQIDLVLLTHLHPEHVGGMVTADGAPVFANARVVCCRTEWRWWNETDRPAGLPTAYQRFVPLARAATRPYAQAQRPVTFTGTETVSQGIVGFPALGHTAGHSLFRLVDGSSRLLTLGDTVLHATQLADPNRTSALDQHPESAARTRRQILGDAVRERWPVIGSQLAAPTVGRVRSNADGFVLDPWA